jgi:hypothetical protein
MSYPKFVYHKHHGPKLVHHAGEHEALGEEWTESPADHGVITCPDEHQAATLAPAARHHYGHQAVKHPDPVLDKAPAHAAEDESAAEAPKKGRKKAAHAAEDE